jgi:3-hydroxyacyl-[acyl-carrier-protein] dehydratase
MPPPLLFDLSQIDLSAKPVFDREVISRVNPQQFEMQQLDGVLWFDKANMLVLGYKDVTDREFWVQGHIPGRPLMPGVIMIESAAQLLSRKYDAYIQGLVGDRMVFETEVSGMSV